MTRFLPRLVRFGRAFAARAGGRSAALLLLALIAASPLRAQDIGAETQAMFDAVLRDDLAAVKRHVEAGAVVMMRNPRGLTAAELAVEIGHIEIANYLLAEEKARAGAASRPAIAEKGSPKSARAKGDAKAARPLAAGREDEPSRPDRPAPAEPATTPPTVPPPTATTAEAPPRPPRRPKTLVERLADLMRSDPSDSEPPPAKPVSRPPETPAGGAERPSELSSPADTPSDAKTETTPTPAERIAERMKAASEQKAQAREPLPPPKTAQRSRTFFEWMADSITGREPREATRPRLPEGLREPPETVVARSEPPPPDLPTPGVRDPWAPVVAPAAPSITTQPSVPAPPPAAVAALPPAAIAPPSDPAPAPGPAPGAGPGPWAPVVEHGGETPPPASAPQIAALPQTPSGAAQEPPTLFARRTGPPPGPASATPGPSAPPASPPAPGAKPAEAKSAAPTEGGFWGSTVEMAQARPQVTAPPAAPPVPENVPAGLGFMVGRSLNLDKVEPPRGDPLGPSRGCVEKSRGAVVFCVEAANWPQGMEEDFTVNTILYTGQQAVVRYDRGVATRMQTLFPSDSFDKVVAYYAGHYGPPAEYWTRSIAPLAAARRENPTRVWRARNPKTGQIATLEIRKFDDTRGGFPDTRRGVVMLYYQEAAPIFPQVSALELMRLKRPPTATPDEGPPGGLFPDTPGEPAPSAPGDKPAATTGPPPAATGGQPRADAAGGRTPVPIRTQ